jgi:hypothetical protein
VTFADTFGLLEKSLRFHLHSLDIPLVHLFVLHIWKNLTDYDGLLYEKEEKRLIYEKEEEIGKVLWDFTSPHSLRQVLLYYLLFVPPPPASIHPK